jgi:hypothetical protein
LQFFDCLHHLRQVHRLAHVPVESDGDISAELPPPFSKRMLLSGIRIFRGCIVKRLCHSSEQGFSGHLLGTGVPERIDHILILGGSIVERIHRVLNFLLNADAHVEFDWRLVIDSSEHTAQSAEAIDASQEHLVRGAQSTAARIPQRMPRQLFHAAELITQWKPVEARKNLSAFQPCKNQLEQNAEESSDHHGEQDRVDPVVRPSFDCLHRMLNVDDRH